MVHEEPIIQDCNDTTDIPKEPEQQIVVNEPIIMTTKVQEKKITDYNLFLTYKLQELKKNNNNKTNKELFNTAIQEWKELKKNSAELQKLLDTLKKESKFEK
jgi:hypothetical protein